MCNLHNKVNGMNAVELYAEARILNNVCQSRYYYLRRQAMSFHDWLDTQEWCADPTEFCKNIVEHVEKALDPDSDKCCDYLFDDKEVDTKDMVADEFTSYQSNMECIADKGMQKAYSKEEKLKELEARLERCIEELKLHDQIQDCIDGLPVHRRVGEYKAVFKRLDARKNEGKLSYSGWVIFSNQLMEKMGKAPIKSKYEIKCVADQIKDLRVKINELNKLIVEKPDYFRDEHLEADQFIRLNNN